MSDFAFLLRDEDSHVRVAHDRHLHGLFLRGVWLDTIANVGFEAHSRICHLSELPEGYELFIGVKR